MKSAMLVCPLLLISSIASAQVCRLTVAGINQNRKVMGSIEAECPFSIHTAPFGNWGVTSNFGSKGDSHQFDGWCHDTMVCDNAGACRTECRDGWYEWNSCTTNSLYRAPNCTLFNDAACTAQMTTTGINVHGTRSVDVPVSCPRDTNGDGVSDAGGCRDLTSYSNGVNFMSLYELDPGTTDDLVQTLYFPETPVSLSCSVWGCSPASSAWVTPSFYDSPPSPAKVYAEMAMVVGSALFVNSGCAVTGTQITSLSGASYTAPIAPNSIASAFGDGLATGIAAGETLPLPTALAGTSVRVSDRLGATRAAPLFYVSPGQVNYLVPEGTAVGPANVTVSRTDGVVLQGQVQVARVAPGLFSADASGSGVAAAVAVRVKPSGVTSTVPVYQCFGTGCVATPIDLGPAGDQVILLLFGTGIRDGDAASAKVTIGGVAAQVQYAGPQGQYVGLDQINVLLPRTLRGRGQVSVVFSISGIAANRLSIAVQ